MKQKPAFFLAAALSFFILATLAGVLAVVAKPATAQTEAQVGASTQEIEQILAEQEAAYSQAISEANQQLLEAQAVIDSLQPVDNASVAADQMVAAEAALEIASQAAQGNNAPTSAAELVNFEGHEAYEVAFAAGNIYVDAVTGEVLFNGTVNLVPPDISAERAAQLAAAYMGRNEVYKVEMAILNGAQVYRVKFINGDAVFVSMKGVILLVRLDAPGGGGGSTSSSGEHEHEEHEHDDD